MKKVLIISYYWPPSGGPGVQRWVKFVKYLPSNGFKPIVVVPDNPEYPVIDHSLEADIPAEAEIIKLPIWEPYWIFKKLTGRKKEEKVNTGLLFDEKKQSLIEKILLWIRGNFLIPDPRLFWVNSSVKQLKKIIPGLNIDAIITTGPPHSVHLIGYQLKKNFGIPWIADLRDPWSNLDILDKFYPTKLARRWHRKIEKRALTTADQLISVSPTWASELEKVVNKPVEVIANGYDTGDFGSQKNTQSNRFLISHVGMINSFRNQNALWEALDEICAESEEFKQKLSIQFVGTYDPKLNEVLNQYNQLSGKLVFSGYIPHSEVKHKYAESDCLLLLQNKSKNTRGHIPAKVFEYLASEKPILALAEPESDIGKIITSCNGGFVCNFDDKDSLKKFILSIYRNEIPKPNLQEIEAFSRINLTKKLTKIIEKTINKSSYQLKQNLNTGKKKVLIITYYWPPSGGPGVQRWVKFAKYLSKMDVETFVLTVDPKYATYPQTDKSLCKDIPVKVKVFYSKSFELYSLYKKVSSNKEVPYGGFVNTQKVNFLEKVLRFIRGNFFLPDPRKGWNRYAIKKASEIIKTHNINTVITTSPPHSTQLIGLKLKKTLDIKWIADFRDPWTDIYYYKLLYPTKIATIISKYLERKVLSNADKIITVSSNFKSLLSSKIINSENKIEVITNGFDLDDFKDTKINIEKNLFYISHIGTIAKNYNLDGFIKGMQSLPEAIKSKIRIRFIGKAAPEIIELFKQTNLENNIELVGYVSHKIAIEYMFSSNILLLVIPEVENSEGIVPGKVFEYLASKNPILALVAEHSDVAKIINETKSGVILESSNSKEIELFILSQIRAKSKSEKYDFDETQSLKYSRENLTIELIKAIENVS